MVLHRHTKLQIYNDQTPEYAKGIWEQKKNQYNKILFKKRIYIYIYIYILVEYFVFNIYTK